MIISKTFQRIVPNAELLPALKPILAVLLQPIEAEGAAIIDCKNGKPTLLCEAGKGSATILNAIEAVVAGLTLVHHAICTDGRPVLVMPWLTSTGRNLIVAFWKNVGTKPWQTQDHQLIKLAVA